MNESLLVTLFTTFVLVQWNLIASVYVYDAVRVHVRTRRAYKLIKPLGNGRALALRLRNQTSVKHLFISTVGLVVGVGSAFRWAFLPHPPADVEVYSMVMTEGLVFILFLMWRIKRDNLAYIRHLDEMREEEHVASQSYLQESVDATMDISKDTNERVTEIQQRGLSDQPKEQLDRDEGKTHRNPVDE